MLVHKGEAFVKIQKKKKIFFGRGGGGGFRLGVRVGGVRVDVYGELSFCENSKKKKFFFGGGGGWVGGGGGGGGGVGLWGVRVDGNRELKLL